MIIISAKKLKAKYIKNVILAGLASLVFWLGVSLANTIRWGIANEWIDFDKVGTVVETLVPTAIALVLFAVIHGVILIGTYTEIGPDEGIYDENGDLIFKNRSQDSYYVKQNKEECIFILKDEITFCELTYARNDTGYFSLQIAGCLKTAQYSGRKHCAAMDLREYAKGILENMSGDIIEEEAERKIVSALAERKVLAAVRIKRYGGK